MADLKLSIRIAGNTCVPCLQVIAAKGYKVTNWFCGEQPGEYENPQWDAEKDGRQFSATSLEELLGLIAMWETRGDGWRVRDDKGDRDDKAEELYDRLVDKALIYDCEGNVVKDA